MPPDLDAIRKALQRLPNPAAVLEGLFGLAPVGFQLYEASGHSILVNQAFLNLFGSEPPPEYNVLRDEIAEKNGVLHLIRRAFAGETVTLPVTWYDPRELEQVHIERGNRVAIVATFFPLFDREGRVTHVGVIFHNVTAEAVARESLESERELLSTVIEQVAEGIIVVDQDGTLRIANRAARAIGFTRLGVPWDELPLTSEVRTADATLMPKERMPLFRALRGEVSHCVIHVPTAEGERALVVSAAPLQRADGSIRGAVMALRDETERMRRDEEASRAAHFRERFIGILGHDLRSPLTAISANAGLILRHRDLPDPVTAAATRMATTAMRMGRMISDLLDFTQARLGGGLSVQRRAVDLGEVAQSVLDEVLASHPSRAATLRTSGDVQGAFDPDRISQLLANLMNNAFAYAPEGEPVETTVEGREREVEIRVTNRGAPIPPAELSVLFDPFRRGSSSSNRQGLGLGLYIVQQIAAAHGGVVSVSSTEEATVFTARLQR